MKYVWIWMLIIAYAGWAIISIIDIVASVNAWISTNTKEVTDNSQLTPVTKKVWTGESPIEDIFDYMEDETKWFLIVTVAGLFVISFGSWFAGCVSEHVIKPK